MTDHASPAKERRKADLRYAAVGIVAVSSFATMAIWMQGLSNDLRVSNQARDALARQVQSLGHKPVAGPPGSRGEAGQSVVGPRGPKGDTGASGKPAPTITPKPGASGASGAAGKPGVDSTVAGPTGPPGASSTVEGPAGPAGPAGQDGQNGQDGRDGTDGQPPAGWTYTWTDSVGVTHTVTCTRAADFDPSSPQYDCTDSTPSSPPAAPSNPEAGLLMLSAVTARKRSQATRQKAHLRQVTGRHRSAGHHGGAHR